MSNDNHFFTLPLLEELVDCGRSLLEIKGETMVKNRRKRVTVCVAVIRDGADLLLVLPRTVIALVRKRPPWVLKCKEHTRLEQKKRGMLWKEQVR